MLLTDGVLASPFLLPLMLSVPMMTLSTSTAGASCKVGRSTICNSSAGRPDGWGLCRNYSSLSSRGNVSKFCDQLRPLYVLSFVPAFAGPTSE